MRTDILIVSYLKDLPYLELNLRTIAKFCSGFGEVVLLIPQDEEGGFQGVFKLLPSVKVKTYDRNVPRSHWHLKHQAEKCHSEHWCPDADFVLHTDSDCLFIEPVTPEDYLSEGKPVMLYESYSRMPGVPWKSITEYALRRPVEFEFMRRHPQVNPLGVYPALRQHVEKVHRRDFDEFVMSRRPDFPWGFSEHNALGAFAYYDSDFHDQYHWHNVATDGVPREKLIQFWSGTDINTPQEISHGGRYTPKTFAEHLLG